MKRFLPLTLLALASIAQAADNPYTRTIFQDDFNAEGFGKQWGHYKSGSVVKGGMLVGITPEGSDHSAVDNIKFPGEKDLEVSVKFRFVSDKAKSFNVWFDDKDYKGSHAGHICQATISPKNVQLSDAKTGAFDLSTGINERRKAKTMTEDDKKLLASKTKSFKVDLALNEWHTLVVQTKGEELSVSIDGKPVGSFSSVGVGHETKSLVSLTTNPVDVEYDDFSLKGVAK